MRDILEDAQKHMDDGYGRAQKHARQELRIRFYKSADVAKANGGFTVQLDGRGIKTPGRVPVVVGSRDLAEKLASEWRAQGEHIDPLTMPLTRLVNAAVEGGPATAQPLRDEIVKYAGNDLLLFRADTPQELVEAQERVWGGTLNRISEALAVSFVPVVGIIHQDQPAETLERLSRVIAGLDHVSLTALMSITNLTGSGLLAIALLTGLDTAENVWSGAHVDEDHNLRLWGADAEALKRRAKRKVEFDAAVTVLALSA